MKGMDTNELPRRKQRGIKTKNGKILRGEPRGIYPKRKFKPEGKDMNKKYLMLDKPRMVLILALWVTIFINPVNIFGQEKRETQEIRERLIRIEERMVTKEELKAEIKDVRNEIKDVRNEIKEFMLWGFGITFAGIFALIGFVLWDRRTALAPTIRKSREVEEREERIERALKEMAQKDSNVAEALKHAGLL
jgi:uncharacterized protein YdhG (YjbR/CyaY superfamily)